MLSIIRIKRREVYGKPLNYPIDFADQLEALTGRKTLTERDINALRVMGFDFVCIAGKI